jgi:hypothetical protein
MMWQFPKLKSTKMISWCPFTASKMILKLIFKFRSRYFLWHLRDRRKTYYPALPFPPPLFAPFLLPFWKLFTSSQIDKTFLSSSLTLRNDRLPGFPPVKNYLNEGPVWWILLQQLFIPILPENLRARLEPGNNKGGSITVPLTSCLTGLE